MKKIILFLGILLFASMANADLIHDYSMPDTVPLDDYIAIAGTFVDDLNISTNVQCDFYFSKDGIELYRFTSQNTDERGHFFIRAKLPSSIFQMNEDYNATTVCGNAVATKQIEISQRKTPYGDIASWWLWITNPETIFFPILIAIFVFLVVFVIYFIHKAMKQGKVNF